MAHPESQKEPKSPDVNPREGSLQAVIMHKQSPPRDLLT